jgi:hypothetical protein
LEDYLLAEGLEAETLELAEHFLPIVRADGGLMPHVVPELCGLIFVLPATRTGPARARRMRIQESSSRREDRYRCSGANSQARTSGRESAQHHLTHGDRQEPIVIDVLTQGRCDSVLREERHLVSPWSA